MDKLKELLTEAKAAIIGKSGVRSGRWPNIMSATKESLIARNLDYELDAFCRLATSTLALLAVIEVQQEALERVEGILLVMDPDRESPAHARIDDAFARVKAIVEGIE